MNKTLTLLCLLLMPLAVNGNEELPPLDPAVGVANHTGQGRWLLVKIWASTCGICNREAKQYVDFHDFNEDGNAAVVGVSLDGADQRGAQRFIEKHEVSYPNLIADYSTGSDWYEAQTGERFRGTPAFLLYDPEGKLRASQIGAVPAEMIEQFIAENSQ